MGWYFICSILCLISCLTAWAESGGGAVPKSDGTEVMAGVAVDYMGQLKFVVLERGTNEPIPGASIEIYMPGLERYVLVGISDADGIYEQDVAYNRNPDWPESEQVVIVNGKLMFQGTLL